MSEEKENQPATPPEPAPKAKPMPDWHQVIATRLNAWRPKSWEDSISRNSLDNEPFENLPPISERLDDLKLDDQKFIRQLFPQNDWPLEKLREVARRDSSPIPSPPDRENYSPGLDGNYWLTGYADYLKIVDVAQRYGVNLDRIFDFGCASGRVIRHFATHGNQSEIWGSDINARHIRWLAEFLPQNVVPIANHCIPTLPISDNSMDLVSAFSVFTHIDTFETCWLAELRRILKPGGIAYLTVHNEDTWDLLKYEIDNEKNRLVQSMIEADSSMAEKLLGPLPEGRTVVRFTNLGPYRAQVFHSNNYLRKVWGRFFEFLEVLPKHHIRQTVLVLRKAK